MFKTIKESETTITELMIPSYANFGGKVHGGIILSLMDKVAYVCAAKHAEKYCVTANVGGVDFLAPVEVGDLVHLKASVNYVGRTSLMVGIKVETENFHTKTITHTNSSYFTFVAIEEDGKPSKVPGLILENATEVRRFAEGKLRKHQKKVDQAEFDALRRDIIIEAAAEEWVDENCQVKL